MLILAIFDADPVRRRQTEATVLECLHSQPMQVKVQGFSSIQAFLCSARRHGFDVYLLDISGARPDALEAAGELRRSGDDGQIIFLSDTAEHALAAFDVRARHYFLYPPEPFRFRTALLDILLQLQQECSQLIPVRTHTTTELVNLDDILFAELQGRSVRYVLRGGVSITSVTMRVNFAEAVAPLLCDGRFALSGASYAINLHFVRAIGKDGVVFTDGTHCSPPKKALAGLREKWLDYWLLDQQEL